MCNTKLTIVVLCVAALLFGTAGCKPTEKNYQAAYEIAKKKRQELKNDPDLDLSELKVIGEPEELNINGSLVKTVREPLRYLNSDKVECGKYNVAVGAYRMQGNATAHKDRLVGSGENAVVAQNSKDIYYTIILSSPDRDEAIEKYNSLPRNSSNVIYPGLGSSPVLVFNPLGVANQIGGDEF